MFCSFADTVMIEHLLKTLVGILDDDSAVATRHSLSALQLCLPLLVDSCHGRLGLQLLLDLIKVKNNPYWLVKVGGKGLLCVCVCVLLCMCVFVHEWYVCVCVCVCKG